MSNIFGVKELTAEMMRALPIRAASEDTVRHAEYLRRYIEEGNPQSWARLLMFATSTVDPTMPITLQYNGHQPARAGALVFVQAHTCFGILDVGDYNSYEHFRDSLDASIENSTGLDMA